MKLAHLRACGALYARARALFTFGIMRKASKRICTNTSSTEAFKSSLNVFIQVDTLSESKKNTPFEEDVFKALDHARAIQSVIDRTYTLEQIPVAHRYVETRQKLGHIVINIDHQSVS